MPVNEISWDGESEGASDLMNNPALADFTSINGLAKAFVDTKAMVGNSVRIPSKEATDEARAEFLKDLQEKVPGLMPAVDLTDDVAMAALYTQLGRPEEASGYEFPELEGITISDDRKKQFRDTAFNAGLTGSQFKKYVEQVLTAEHSSSTAKADAQREEMQGLRNEWGMAFESKYETAVKIAEAVGASESTVKALREQTAPVDTVKFYDNLVKVVGSEDFQIKTLPPGGGGITPSEARARAGEIRDKLQDQTIPAAERSSLIKRMMEFDQMAKAS